MKKLFLLLFSQLVLCLAIFAQNTETQMDDLERVAISVNLTDCKLDSNAKEVLNSKLLQLISSNGLGHIGEGAIFYLKPIISLVSRNVTSTQPIYNVCVIEISLSIEDRFEGNIYGNIKSKYKGVGKSEADAYAKAINKIDTRNRAYRAFIRIAKIKIIEFYNTKIDMIIDKAKAYIAKGEIEKAKELLISVPPICRESYDKAMEVYKKIK